MFVGKCHAYNFDVSNVDLIDQGRLLCYDVIKGF